MSKPLRPQDSKLIFDQDADPQQVAFALNRAQFAPASELRPLETRVRELLQHRDAEVRGEAAKVLLIGLASAPDVDRVIALLRADKDEYSVARSSATLALSAYTASHPERRHDVLRALAETIKYDADWGVQLAAYQDFLRLVSPNEPFDAGLDVFDAESMVDWELVNPYLARSS